MRWSLSLGQGWRPSLALLGKALLRRSSPAVLGAAAMPSLAMPPRRWQTGAREFLEDTGPLMAGLDKPRILITGAMGQLGASLAQVLRQRYGRESVLMSDIVKPPRRLWMPNAPYVYIDVMDRQSLEAAIVNNQNKIEIDWVVHFSAILSAVGEKNVPLALRINVTGAQNVIEIALAHKLRLFLPSTIGAFGPESPKVATPDVTIQRPKTIYGVAKTFIELLGEYLNEKSELDFRCLRFPGVISATEPGGGTTDYAVKIFHDAIKYNHHECYLKPDTRLPMMYIDDTLRAVVEMLESRDESLRRRTYNVSAMAFTPAEIADAIRRHRPDFTISYQVDPKRQAIAESWPQSLDDSGARRDWGWAPRFDLPATVERMLALLEPRPSRVPDPLPRLAFVGS